MTGGVAPGVYIGTLRHRRFAPVSHEFTYPLFMVLLDIDRIPELMRASRFTSYERWNWGSFHEADHFGDAGLPLRQRLAADAARHGVSLPDGPIFLLTNLRYLGYCFNPVSFFYCYDRGGSLKLVLAEVNNTFGGAHNYWLEAEEQSRPTLFQATAVKSFYVSPFMPPDMTYSFSFTEPASQLVAHMSLRPGQDAASGPMFDATLRLAHSPWTATSIRRALLRQPAMTLKVMAAIHLEALRLWWKGLPIVPRPTPDGVYPESAVPNTGPAVSES